MGGGQSLPMQTFAIELRMTMWTKTYKRVGCDCSYYLIPGNTEATLETLLSFYRDMRKAPKEVERISVDIFVPTEITDEFAASIQQVTENMIFFPNFTKELVQLRLYDFGPSTELIKRDSKELSVHVTMFNRSHKPVVANMLGKLFDLTNYPPQFLTYNYVAS